MGHFYANQKAGEQCVSIERTEGEMKNGLPLPRNRVRGKSIRRVGPKSV